MGGKVTGSCTADTVLSRELRLQRKMGVSDVQMNYYYTGTFDATQNSDTGSNLVSEWNRDYFVRGSGVGQSVMAAADALHPASLLA